MIFIDQHTHSQFSPDSRMDIDSAIKKIDEINLGYSHKTNGKSLSIGGIAFTDHLDLEAPRSNGKFNFNVAEQQREIELNRLKIESYNSQNQIKIYKGIEVGLQLCCIKDSLDFIHQYNFDVVIGSVHFIDGLDPFVGSYFLDKGYKSAFGRALEVIYQNIVAFKDFDILGHFDYVTRYSPYDVKDMKYKDFGDYLDPILKFLAENGKALEINTKSYSKHKNGHLQELDPNILKRFKELGGEFITLGSDAHSVERIGENFEKFATIAAECGFKKLTYFEKRKPHLIG